ncbi:MAG: translational GTPase TypA [Paludibacteraceae bacterium]|nr:translational GTPase TypA [Paludibacteraceae bacterium]
MQKIRNIAIIAHVDHGKTTLVDKMLYTAKVVQESRQEGVENKELILDNNDLERERGITILAKNVAIDYKGYKINIIDTPGHADFGGEVERVLNMADGVLLLVDAFEGPMPQTRFVLQKALELNLKPIVVINKVDKLNCRPDEVQEAVFDLMLNLDATDDQLDFQTIYGSAKNGWMSTDWHKPTTDLTALMDAIIEYIPAPEVLEGTPQMLITSLDYNPYVGRIAVGRVHRGTLKDGQQVMLAKKDGTMVKTKIKELHTFSGMGHTKTDQMSSGDICALIGIDGFEIGDTICDIEHPEPLKPIAIDEPTMSMTFTINDSPFFGQDGKFVTSRHIHDRLMKELEKNLALRVEPSASDSSWRVYGRGVLHLSVLIETMRREGYELQVGQPQVIIKEIDGVKCEPIEQLTVNTPEECSGKIIEYVTVRKGEMTKMEMVNDRVQLEFTIPSRGIIGMRTFVMNVSAGEAIMAHRFLDFEPYKGDIEKRINGSLIAMETGTASAYALDKLQDRGRFFIDPQEEVYAGQVVGENAKEGDIVINVIKAKNLTNMRSKSADDKAVLAPAVKFSLEEALEYIKEDEYVEVTPKSMRLRKIILDELERKRANR